MVELKMIAGAFLTIGITGAVISIVQSSLLGFGLFLGMSVISAWIILKRWKK